jgi:LysR family transcriptional regulator of abg operon
MKLHHIRDIVAIADAGSLRAAAQHLGLAQPALTRSIRELEHELDAVLFERQARGMRPTPLGEAFIRRARAIQNDLRNARDELEQLKGHSQGRVAIGLSMASNIALLPAILRPFQKRFPAVKLSIVENAFPALRSVLSDGDLDFYVGPLISPLVSQRLIAEKLFDNERIILSRSGHPLFSVRSLGELAAAGWVGTPITDDLQAEMDPFFDQYGLPPPRIEIETQSALSTFFVAASTDLLAMLPRQWLRHPGVGEIVRHIQVSETLVAPPICLVRRGDLPLTPAAEYLADLVQRAARAEQQNSGQ